jgi:transcriptional regulator with XRE-family HTH domain
MTNLALFPSRFAYACTVRRLSPEEVAERVGLPLSAGFDLDNTAIYLPLSRLCNIADVLDVSLDWLLGRQSTRPHEQARTPRN